MGNRAYRFWIYPNKEQTAFLAKCFGCSRFVYNHFWRLTTDIYADSKKGLRYKEWAKLLTHLKKEYKWLKEVNSPTLRNAQINSLFEFLNINIKGMVKNRRLTKTKQISDVCSLGTIFDAFRI